MSIDPERQELMLLRTIGVLLVLIGLAILVQTAQSGASMHREAVLLSSVEGEIDSCRHIHVDGISARGFDIVVR